MAVDQQRRAGIVGLLVMPAEMDFLHPVERKPSRDSACGCVPWLVADTKTLLTSSNSPQPVRRDTSARNSISGIVLSAKREIGRRIFQQHLAPERGLHLVDMLGDPRQRLLGIGQRQQVVEVDVVMRGPGEMLGKARRLHSGRTACFSRAR